MTLLLAVCVSQLSTGFLLMTRVPRCSEMDSASAALSPNLVSIIIPARNEDQNLPRLLSSIPRLPEIAEIIVVDDGSIDRTAEIAGQHGARVLQPGNPPNDVTGKVWACARGAVAASAPLLLFLDADTFFQSDGLSAMLQTYKKQPHNTALSVLPFAVTVRPYEEFSLFFNLLMAFGAGGFGVFQSSRLFGQSLLLSRELYSGIGGYAAVGNSVLENVHLARNLEAAQGKPYCLGGKNDLHMRMFPDGFEQLCDGWTKAFADGARSTDIRVLAVTILWLSALASIAVLLFVGPMQERWMVATLYLLAAIQVFFFARKIGSFRIATCLLFPLPLIFFFVVFTRSAMRRAFGKHTSWRGRSV
ncbi:glycosyltransferase [Terriglobus roseus]|uniref:4,4'-diaponeurosporenoate glycosyltransferase n=1 Tax=Terriglobus roseus TaxID=392734 RepID=A0A1G7NNJ1_9BACT|nr:glycosyltransferase [Terriglobus roseus]SDF75511.1 4,4'-diaponeurosporenoate glycosyltransferase [Terriglobus roseus]